MTRRARLAAVLLWAACAGAAQAGSYEDFFGAVVRDDPSALLPLIARGFDPNARDPNGQPAVMRALMVDSPKAALALVRAPGFDPEVRNKSGETALMIAALKGQVPVCEALLARGATLDPQGWTPLHYAAAGDSLDATLLLLRRGAAVDALAPNGRTPLMMAAQHADERVVDALLQAGADPTLRDRNARSAADWARVAERDWLGKRLDQAAAARPPGR